MKAALYIGFTVTIWATAFLFNKYGLAVLEPLELAFYRYFLASIILIPFAIYQKIKIPKSLKEWLAIAACGFFGIAAYNFFLYKGQLIVSVGVAGLLVNTAPLFTALFSVVFLKERFKLLGWLGLLISLVGVLLIVLGKNLDLDINIGALYVLIASISFSIYHILQKPLLQNFSGLEIIIWAIWISAVFLLPGAFTLIPKIPSLSVEINAAVLYLAVFPGVLGYISWAMANSLMPATKASSFLFLTPVFAFILSYIVLNEIPSVTTIIGGIFALSGVYVVNKFGK